MKQISFWILFLGFAIANATRLFAQPADLVFTNAAIYTVDVNRTWAEAMAIKGDQIAYVGANPGIEKWIGPETRVIDARGKMLLPGFHDSHVHLVGGGVEMGECDINGLTKLDEILTAIESFAAQHPEKVWIRGGGWPLTLNGGNPRKETLDKIVSDRPVVIEAFDGHSTWVNSKALELAGITSDTPDPARGRIERDQKTGEPTGTLRESAIRLVTNKIPPYTAEDYTIGLRRGLKEANRVGITSVQEAAIREGHLAAYSALEESGELTVKAVGALQIEPEKMGSQLSQFVDWRDKFRTSRFRPTSVKIFLDGVIESQTAALIEPYAGTDKRGWLNIEPEVLKPLAADLDRLGFQIHIHAIGDRAIQSSLDAFEFARARNGSRDSRHHIAHIQLFDPQDIARFRQLGVVANFQPFWASADEYIVKMTEPALGPERSRWLYPIRSVANSGAIIAAGSDWSVSSISPLDAIQVAVTRRGTDEEPGPPWLPEEVVDLPLMLAAYTINGAYVNFQERQTGSIEVGKAADLVLLDRNLFEIPKFEIHQTKVLLTLLDGKTVYRDPDYQPTEDAETVTPIEEK